MNNPTITNAGPVACAGIIPNTGNKNKLRKKKNAVDKAVRPVLPPSATPDADSTNVVTVLVPSRAPAVVPIASANNAGDASFNFPCSSNIPAFALTPTKVPTVSKISTNKNVNTTVNISKVNILSNCILKATGANDGGNVIGDPPWYFDTPKINARIVEAKIPYINAPLISLAKSKAIMNNPTINTTLSLLKRFPNCKTVPSPCKIIPEFTKPTSAMKSPIPQLTAFFKLIGIASKIISLTLNNERIKNTIPSKNTAVKANCQV